MRIALVLMACLALAGTAAAADIAKGPAFVEGEYTDYNDNVTGRSTILVVSIIQGTFTDQGPTWAAALGGADLIYDPMGAYPDLSGYTMMLVDTADMWWTYDFGPDEAVWAGFVDDGNCCFVVGQDYFYSRGYYTGFPMDYLGLASVVEDVALGTSYMEWYGNPGGILDGLSDAMFACFEANGFYTDSVTPAVEGIAEWFDETGAGGEAGCLGNLAGFSAVEFACGAAVTDVAGRLIEFCGGVIPTEETSWGQIKNDFK